MSEASRGQQEVCFCFLWLCHSLLHPHITFGQGRREQLYGATGWAHTFCTGGHHHTVPWALAGVSTELGVSLNNVRCGPTPKPTLTKDTNKEEKCTITPSKAPLISQPAVTTDRCFHLCKRKHQYLNTTLFLCLYSHLALWGLTGHLFSPVHPRIYNAQWPPVRWMSVYVRSTEPYLEEAAHLQGGKTEQWEMESPLQIRVQWKLISLQCNLSKIKLLWDSQNQGSSC